MSTQTSTAVLGLITIWKVLLVNFSKINDQLTNEWVPNKAGVKRELFDAVKARKTLYHYRVHWHFSFALSGGSALHTQGGTALRPPHPPAPSSGSTTIQSQGNYYHLLCHMGSPHTHNSIQPHTSTYTKVPVSYTHLTLPTTPYV